MTQVKTNGGRSQSGGRNLTYRGGTRRGEDTGLMVGNTATPEDLSAKSEPTGRRAKVEYWARRPKAEPGDPNTKAEIATRMRKAEKTG